MKIEFRPNELLHSEIERTEVAALTVTTIEAATPICVRLSMKATVRDDNGDIAGWIDGTGVFVARTRS